MKKKKQNKSVVIDGKKMKEFLMKTSSERWHVVKPKKNYYVINLKILKDKNGILRIIDEGFDIPEKDEFGLYSAPFALPEKIRKFFENELRDTSVDLHNDKKVIFSMSCNPRDLFTQESARKYTKDFIKCQRR
jgi:hypothetical protein